MKFSVIVPLYNEAPYIRECAQSLLRQRFDKDQYEIIFIDNGSTDGSSEALKSYPEIILLQEHRIGSYATRNRGLAHAKGDIIAFTDADCRVSPDWLAQIYDGMNQSGADIALGKRIASTCAQWPLKLMEAYDNTKIDYILSRKLKRYFFAYTNNMAVRSKVFQRAGQFSEIIRGADTLFIHNCISLDPLINVCYIHGMEIEHLELKSLGYKYKKMYIYGNSNYFSKSKCDYSPLGFRKQIDVFRTCVVDNGYSFVQSSFLLSLLAVGKLCYRLGEVRGAIMGLSSRR